jgi:hypothetical protein
MTGIFNDMINMEKPHYGSHTSDPMTEIFNDMINMEKPHYGSHTSDPMTGIFNDMINMDCEVFFRSLTPQHIN